MHAGNTRRFTLLALCLGFLTADAADAAKVDIRGTITRLNPGDDATRKEGILGYLLVEGQKEKDTEHDKARIRVTDKTKIERLVEGARKPAEFKDLKRGMKVQATFTGPVAESYPVQAAAGTILILE